MSLVGTRPILQEELRQYELHHRARIAIKPGITGMWQVSGRSDITDFEEVVRLDTEYISNWNFGEHSVMYEYAVEFGDERKSGIVRPEGYNYQPGFAGVYYNFAQIPDDIWRKIKSETIELLEAE